MNDGVSPDERAERLELAPARFSGKYEPITSTMFVRGGDLLDCLRRDRSMRA